MGRLYRIIQRALVVLFFFVLLIYVMIEAKTMLYPLVLAMLFSFLLLPVANYLERKGFTRILTNFIVIFATAAIISIVVYLLYSQLGLLVKELPELKDQAHDNVDQMAKSISSRIGVSTADFKEWVNDKISMLDENGFLTNNIIPSTTATIMAIGLMPVYIFLMLYYRDKIYHFMMMIFPDRLHEKAVVVIGQISQVTKHYMRGVFLVVLILCFLNSVGLLIVGVKFAILLGIISALCNFIPYFGTLIGAVFPLLMAIFTGESSSEMVGVIVLFVLIQFTENNVLTPNITGGAVQINPMVTIISIIAGGMIWGIPGMFVVVPIIGMIKIVLDNYEPTRPLAFLIGTSGTEKHSVTMTKLRRFFTIKKSLLSDKTKQI
jgi:predicted PurR-regulated permease PerM